MTSGKCATVPEIRSIYRAWNSAIREWGEGGSLIGNLVAVLRERHTVHETLAIRAIEILPFPGSPRQMASFSLDTHTRARVYTRYRRSDTCRTP